jgi:hypothetical protein
MIEHYGSERGGGSWLTERLSNGWMEIAFAQSFLFEQHEDARASSV